MSSHPCLERLLLPEALSGRLDPAEEKRVMAHLEGCPACQDAAADIEIALVALATLRVARDEVGSAARPAADQPVAPLTGIDPGSRSEPAQVIALHGRHPVRRGLLAVAAAIVLLAAGAAVGRQLLPPRDTVDYGPALALAPPPGAADRAAAGTVKVGTEGNALAVRLTATSLPAAGWFECVWTSEGQTRSAGSFRADHGAVNVELRVAPPKTPGSWDLQVIAHTGTSSQVVLEGSATVPS